MKLRPLNDNVLLELIDNKDDPGFFESVDGGSIREFKVVAIPKMDDLEIEEGSIVLADCSALTKKAIDGVEYHISDIKDLIILKLK